MNGPDGEPGPAATTGTDEVDAPTVDSDGVPSKCLSFVVRADWGHFRRIDRTVTKQTYRLPPRTTVAGLTAAIAGVRRDGYYDVFAPGQSAVAVTPQFDIRTVTEPSLGLGTNPGETFSDAGGSGKKTIKVRFPDSTDNRQIHSYELLVDPAYRIDLAVEDAEFYGALKDRLETGTSYYPPSMGLSEYLAWIEPVGSGDEPVSPDDEPVDPGDEPVGPDNQTTFEFEPKRCTGETVAVDGAVPEATSEIVPRAGETYRTERMPAFMEADSGGRSTTGYANYAFRLREDEQIELRPDSATPVEVGGQTVVFH
jgi:CRISPR-associated protein Cas5h